MGGKIPRDLAPGRAKSLGISPRGQIPGGGGEIPATPEFHIVLINHLHKVPRNIPKGRNVVYIVRST